MKLTGELKKKVDAAGSRDEAKRTIADAGMELTDDELSQVAGGTGFNWDADILLKTPITLKDGYIRGPNVHFGRIERLVPAGEWIFVKESDYRGYLPGVDGKVYVKVTYNGVEYYADRMELEQQILRAKHNRG